MIYFQMKLARLNYLDFFTSNNNLTFPFLTNDPSKLAKCQSVIDVKILVIVESSNSFIDTTFKCLVKRLVISFLPPPGGPIAATSS